MNSWKYHGVRGGVWCVVAAVTAWCLVHVLGVFYWHWTLHRPAFLAAFKAQHLCVDAAEVVEYNLGDRCRQDEEWRQLGEFGFWNKIVRDTYDEERRHPAEWANMLRPSWWMTMAFGIAVGRNSDLLSLWAGMVVAAVTAGLGACLLRMRQACARGKSEYSAEQVRRAEVAAAEFAASQKPFTLAMDHARASCAVPLANYVDAHDIWKCN